MSVTEIAVELADRYEKRSGRVHLTGIQALARLPIDQSRLDRRNGLPSGTYISGYEGSPLGGYDLELGRQAALLDENEIVFRPGLNEELAATAVQGTQLIAELKPTVPGVTGFWYGKAPGLDRAADALRHANLTGTSPLGGVVAFVGDDPAAKSSSVPCASEGMLAELGMPAFYPADAAEILEYGRHAVALSRASGLWSAMKIVTAVADGSAALDLEDDEFRPVLPEGSGAHQPNGRLLQPVIGPLERGLVTTRMQVAREYIAANQLNRTVVRHDGDRIGLVASGKTYLDLLEALARLGLDEHGLARLGVRILKLGVIWPLTEADIAGFAVGLEKIIVVEEKRAFIETELKALLYGGAATPQIIGKRRADGRDLFPAHGELDADAIATGLADEFEHEPSAGKVREWLEARHARSAPRTYLPLVQRSPYFCSGCPHNTSTKPHADSPVGAGIGCHALVLLMNEEQVGQVVGLTQMGGEGATWSGMSPFVADGHFVQNLGDGTFHHSGSLAVRASVAAGVNITYRLLYNSTVAMTGGQDAVGQMTVADVARSLLADGVTRIIVTTDDVRAVRRQRPPRQVQVWHRSRIADAERTLAHTSGTTVLIHEQECATEVRRKRKRGQAAAPGVAAVINERICEGCGDCGQKSNCMSVHPVQTEYGRKTAIHQGTCNTDLTCLSGDCPAFMTVRGGRRPSAGTADLDAAGLPAPAGPAVTAQAIRLMGIGGTGVVTTSQILATAAVMSGRYVRTLDQTGVAQKGGAVVSDVKFSAEPLLESNKIAPGECDLYLGCDLLAAADQQNLTVLGDHTTAIVSTSVVPTGAMVSDKDIPYPEAGTALGRISERVPSGSFVATDSLAYCETLFGAAQFANMFLLGIAFQSGALALSDRVVEEAIRLNGAAVAQNIQAFRRGRQYIADRTALDDATALVHPVSARPAWQRSEIVHAGTGSALERIVGLRRQELAAYQNTGYAARYERLVEKVREAESQSGVGETRLSEAIARYAYKVMAYKDEYEVARLARDPETMEAIAREFGPGARAQWRLHPPTLRKLGLRKKLSLGPWFGPVFSVLYRMRGLRGTPLDPFGRGEVRTTERRLAAEYLDTVEQLIPLVDAAHYDDLVRLAELPDMIRGYEQVKLTSVKRYDQARDELVSTLGIDNPGSR